MSEVKRPTPRLFQGLKPDLPVEDVVVGRQLRAPPVIGAQVKPAIDLTGKPKILMVIAPGGAGKSTWLRYAAECALAADPHCTTIFSAVGDRRDLVHYFPTVSQPDSYDPVQETRWLEALLSHCIENKVGAAIDFDGGDTTVTNLVQRQDDICATLEAQGVAVVAVYLLTPRVTDLTTLATLEQSGFQPKATLLVLNDGIGDPTVPFDTRFGAIMNHAVFRAAQARGAVTVRMPRLFPAAKVEAKRMSFADAGTHLPFFDAGSVRMWLAAMDAAFASVKTWLP